MPENEKPKKSQADQSIAKLRCSKCLRDDVLHFNPQKYMFECTACGADFLNPFAIGPWDKRIAIIERLSDERVVSAYVVETIDADPAEINENYIEFMKSLHDSPSLANREIKDDWGLPASATKKRRRKKKATEEKIEVPQEA